MNYIIYEKFFYEFVTWVVERNNENRLFHILIVVALLYIVLPLVLFFYFIQRVINARNMDLDLKQTYLNGI